MCLQDEQSDFPLCSSNSLTTGGSHVLLELHEQAVIWIYSNETSQHPPTVPHTYMHIHTEELTHRHTHTLKRKCMHTHKCMYKCPNPHTLTQQVALRLACRSLCGCTEFLFNPTLPMPQPLQLAVSKHPWHCRDLEDCGQRDGHKAHWGRKTGSNWEEEIGRVFSLTPCVPASTPKCLEVYRKDLLEMINMLLMTCFYVYSAPRQKGHIYLSQHSHKYWNINM